MKKIILALSVLLVTNAMAYQVATSTVKAINTNPTSVIIELNDAIANGDSCSHPNSTFTLILPLTEATKAQYSALLSATVSGMQTRVLYDGCLGDLPKIIRVDLKK